MHSISKHVSKSHYDTISKLQEVFCIKGHLGPQTPMGGNLSDLDILSINIFPEHPIHLLLSRQYKEHPKSPIHLLNGRRQTINILAYWRKHGTFEYQHNALSVEGANWAMTFEDQKAKCRYQSLPAAKPINLLKQCSNSINLKTVSIRKGCATNSAWMMGWGIVPLHSKRVWTLLVQAQSNSSKLNPQTYEPSKWVGLMMESMRSRLDEMS